MKIDKVIWSSSAEYSDFWNINSKLHKERLGIDCLLLLYGNKQSCNLSEEYGKIVELDFIPGLPKMVQLVWNKFYYTQYEPNTTWLIGDIDQLPLQRRHFVDNIKHVPDDFYVHLAEDAITSLKGLPTESWKSDITGLNAFLTAHYHVAKGSVFKQALDLHLPFETHIKQLISYYYKAPFESLSKINERELWAFEEQYSSRLIRNNYLHKFLGFSRAHGCDNPNSQKIDRGNGCKFDKNRIGLYVDFHCPRPYTEHKTQIHEILNYFWKE